MEICNKIICGDLFDILPKCTDKNVNLCFTSPPYAQQRSKQYGGIPVENYPAWTLSWFNLVGNVLAADGSIILNIREHEKDGQQHPYVFRTIIHLIDNGWKLNGRAIWHKPTSPPLGNRDTLRRAFEDLYWFSRVDRPFIRPKALGRIGQTGFKNLRYFEMGLCKEHKEPVADQVVRSTDVFSVGVNKNKKGNPHPAQFPEELASQLIQIFCPVGGLVLDPFVGSGTTAVAAKINNRNYCGIEKEQHYVDYALSRLGGGSPVASVQQSEQQC